MKKRGELSNGPPPDDASGGGDYQPRPADLDRTTELKLIDSALLGDMQAFSELFEHYRPDLHTLCLQRLNDPSLAEDVVQEVFIKALKSLPNSDHHKPIWPWLSTIAYRMCVDLQRRRSFTHYSADIGISVDAGANGETESALDAVIASEERAEFWKSLEVLPERQRRVFLSYALDGLSCAEIAAAEGISLGAVHLLLFRARKKMRSVHQGRPLPAIVLPFTWLRWKVQQIQERIRPLLGVYSEGFSNACVHAACLGTVAMMVVASGNSVESFEGNDATRFDETIQPATVVQTMQSQSLQTAFPNVAVSSSESAVDSQPSAEQVTDSLMDRISTNKDATPENTIFNSVMASPNYENDHTILGSGYYMGHVMFVSHDGGANWKPPLISRLFVGVHTMVLSPAYAQDRRVFVLGDLGLEQSDDGGEIFRTVSPLLGSSLAVSPSFGKGDSRVLIAGGTIFEYDADLGLTRPASLTLPPSSVQSYYSSVVFSPSHKSDSTVFVSDKYGKSDLLNSKLGSTVLYRCKGSVCEATEFPFPGPLTLRLSPRFDQDGLAYAFTSSRLLVSNDGGRMFRDLQFPLPNSGFIQDIFISWDTSSYPDVFVSVYGTTPGVYHSIDGGNSWTKTSSIDFPGFHLGAKQLIVTPTGRLLAIGTWYGIACSEDKGQTWAPRCTPER